MKKDTTTERRAILKAGLKLGGLLGASMATATGARAATTADPLITEIQDWNRYMGDGVDANPYGLPSSFESDVVRRDVAWLTADAKSSVNFTPLHALDGIITPNGLCFERHHGGVAQIAPSDHRLMINGLVDTGWCTTSCTRVCRSSTYWLKPVSRHVASGFCRRALIQPI